jgi:hypothetical protein
LFQSFLDHVVHKTKFNNNKNLFINQKEFKNLYDSDEDDNSGYNYGGASNWNKFNNNIQDDSDDEKHKKE